MDTSLLAVLLLDGIAVGGLWLVYARSPYARRWRRALRTVGAVWCGPGPVAAPPPPPALESPPAAGPVSGVIVPFPGTVEDEDEIL